MRRGFALGKFMPPHAGHVFLCQTAAALVDQMTVLVCTLEREEIPGADRFAWMQELLPGMRVLHHDRDVPQAPDEHPDFWPIWRDICRAAHPEPIDAVFGSEPYVTRLAVELDAEPVILDPDRLAFPISATAIRADPAAHWDMVPGPVRTFYQRRVVLVGAESVGKTSLAQALARRLGTLHVPEYGRVYDRFNEDRTWNAADFRRIEAVTVAMRRQIARAAGPLVIEDTDPLLTRVWEEALTGVESAAVPVDLADLYLLLDTDVPWVDDGTRYFSKPDDRARFQDRCEAFLRRADASYRIIQGDWAAREKACIAACGDVFPDLINV